MIIYWIAFALPSLASIFEKSSDFSRYLARRTLPVLAVFSVILIGTRYDVGADWDQYQNLFDRSLNVGFSDALNISDPGYMLTNWLSSKMGFGISGANTICALIFCTGLTLFCLERKRPLLAFAVAVPYLLIVVAMGYTRQSAAIGLVMIAIVNVERDKIIRYFIYILAAAAFHKTAIIVAPLGVIATSKNRALTIAASIAILPIAYVAFLADFVQRLNWLYFERGFSSSGAVIRLALSAVAAISYFVYTNKSDLSQTAYNFWRATAICSILLFLSLPISPSSTAIDRLGLYLIPIQLVAFSSLPDAFRANTRAFVTLLVLSVYFAVLFVWLNFGIHSVSWYPYQTYLTL